MNTVENGQGGGRGSPDAACLKKKALETNLKKSENLGGLPVSHLAGRGVGCGRELQGRKEKQARQERESNPGKKGNITAQRMKGTKVSFKKRRRESRVDD